MRTLLSILVVILITLCVNVVHAQKGLVLYFSFDNVSGKEVKDNSGNQNDGKMVGSAEIVDGKMGKALKLDGVSGAIEVPDSDSLDISENSLTMECWINTTKAGGFRRIVSKGDFGWTKGYLFQLFEGSRVAISITNGTNGAAYAASKKTVNDGKWHHVVGIADRDKDEYRIFIDGKQENFELPFNPPWGAPSNPKKVGNISNNNRLTIGKYDVSNVEFLEAMVDELRIWNRVLTEIEIQKAMEGTLIAATAVALRGKLPITWAKLKSR